MAKSIQERVRAAQAAAAKQRDAAEYKAGEAARRSQAARYAALTRKDQRLHDILGGRVEPRTETEWRLLDRAEAFED